MGFKSQNNSAYRFCQLQECPTPIKGSACLCSDHWSLVSEDTKAEVIRCYRQLNRKREATVAEYNKAVRLAVSEVRTALQRAKNKLEANIKEREEARQ